MLRCSAFSTAKLITIIGIYFSLSSLSWADDLRDELIFVQPNADF